MRIGETTMFRGINRAMTAAVAAGLALAILALQPTSASAHSRRNGNAAALAAFTTVLGTIAVLAAEDSRHRSYNRYYGPYYQPYPYYAPSYHYRPYGYQRWHRRGW
jgi:hypothetical protein